MGLPRPNWLLGRHDLLGGRDPWRTSHGIRKEHRVTDQHDCQAAWQESLRHACFGRVLRAVGKQWLGETFRLEACLRVV